MNVLLLTLDTLRTDLLGCYGSSEGLTPNLDDLAAEGLCFTQAITGGSWTQAALPVLLTSSHASLYGGCLSSLSAERPSPVEALAQCGYSTAGFSTNPHLSRQSGYDRGFAHFEDLVPAEDDPKLRFLTGGQRLLRNRLFHALTAPFGKPLRPARIYSSARTVTDRLRKWLDTVDEPFFAWAHYMDVHWPYHLEEALTSPAELAAAWQDVAIMHERANFTRTEEITEAQRHRFLSLYKQALRYLDGELGRLLTYLRETGLDENTVIVVVSDHGEEFLDHGRWGHWESNLYDEIVRVPLIVRLPNSSAGRAIDRQVRTLDIMPTILDLVNCRPPEGVEGASLAPLWRGHNGQYQPAEAIIEMHRPPWHRIAVRTEAYKYIWDSKEERAPELYDLHGDPQETENVADVYPAVVTEMQAIVDRHLSRTRATEPDALVPELELDEETTRRLRALGYLD